MRLSWLACLLLCASCGVTINSHPLNSAPAAMQPREPSDVAMFTTSKPPYPYVEVAMLEARQESMMSVASEEDVFASMREKAAELGCEGLIVTGSADAVAGMSSTSGGTGSGSTRTLFGYRGTCIVRAPAETKPAPPIKVAIPAPAHPENASLSSPPGAPATAATCEPPCSPGYACQAGICAPLCNPACAANEACGGDRICRRR